MSDQGITTFVVNDDNAPESGSYIAEFAELSGPHVSTQPDGGNYYKVLFQGDNRDYIGFADESKMGPRSANKLGRWLLGLAGKPTKSTDRTEVNTSDYIGNKYVLIYAPNSIGNVTLHSFSPAKT